MDCLVSSWHCAPNTTGAEYLPPLHSQRSNHIYIGVRSHGRSHGRQRFIQEEGESPWAPTLTTEISSRNVEIPCCWKSADSEPLYWYLRTCLSSRVFHQIVACISRIALMVALSASLSNHDRDRKKSNRYSPLRAAFVVSRKKKKELLARITQFAVITLITLSTLIRTSSTKNNRTIYLQTETYDPSQPNLKYFFVVKCKDNAL